MIRRILTFASILAAATSLVRAQGPPETLAFSPFNIEFMSGPIAFDTEAVSGAPYSAEAVNDVVQTLADGNRIVRQTKSEISRDSRGRTRREQGFAMFGPAVNTSNGPRHVQIMDPETKTTVMLDVENKLAHRMPAPRIGMAQWHQQAGVAGGANVAVGIAGADELVNETKFEMAVPAPLPGEPAMRVFAARKTMAGEPAARPVVEQLGVQFMEGVNVEGTRTTVTIPAGQIGNEQAINIVSERWFSTELKVLVMSRQSDPRFGETTYRLTNIVRAEPAPDLFEIPADFKVVEPGNTRDVIIERKTIIAK